ncbi:MAG: hypothetical protein V1875_07410 [Candidatus Altiarchaeota archaeon]
MCGSFGGGLASGRRSLRRDGSLTESEAEEIIKSRMGKAAAA